jgi:hypothetical protein
MRVIAPDSYRDIEELLPIIYPNVSLSYGSIQKIAVESGENSRQFLEQADLSGNVLILKKVVYAVVRKWKS